LGPDDGPGLEEIADDLCRWAGSLPWASEMPPVEDDPFGRSFVVDCPVLRCAEPWFALSSLGHGLELGPEVLVVLPDHLAQRGDAHGWAVSLAQLDRERTIAAVALPTTVGELGTLERLLTIAYSAAFPPARPVRAAERNDREGWG
jgi:hypothetical protein